MFVFYKGHVCFQFPIDITVNMPKRKQPHNEGKTSSRPSNKVSRKLST